MLKPQRTAENLNKIINDYLKRGNLFEVNAPWTVKESSCGGLGVFATRNIKIGDVIFRDYPVIIGPRTAVTCPEICVNCYAIENLQTCKNNCGLLICGLNCQNSDNHMRECKIIRQWKTCENLNDFTEKLVRNLTPIRSLLLGEDDKFVIANLKAHKGNQHGREVSVLKDEVQLNIKEDEEKFMRFVCSVMDANAFEVIIGEENKQVSLRGLYPLGGLANHSCVPNTTHVFDDKAIMIVRAANFINEGEEIYHTYTRLLWGTQIRRYHLERTKHFYCRCQRCRDPTEFKSYMGAILCEKCKGNVIPVDPLNLVSKWKCEDCGELVKTGKVSSVTSLLGSILSSFEDGDVEFMLKLLNEKMTNLIHKNNHTAVELKYKLIWILGYSQGFLWSELPDRLLNIKEQLCNDLLSLLETVRAGSCKIRGLLLYELHCTLKERKIRQHKDRNSGNTEVSDKQLTSLLNEAAAILMYDVSAPKEVKEKWPLK